MNLYELINKRSPFVLFNFIRSVGGKQLPLQSLQQQPRQQQTVVAKRTAKVTILRQTTADREERPHRTSSNHTA